MTFNLGGADGSEGAGADMQRKSRVADSGVGKPPQQVVGEMKSAAIRRTES